MSDKKSWIQRHIKDEFVKKAQHEGYISRAAYKLLEIQEKDRIFKPGMVVVDLGAAPGGWCQVAKRFIGRKGKIIAIDLLPLKITEELTFIQGDFNDEAIWQRLLDSLKAVSPKGQADLVISDMAPNLSGNKTIDQPRSLQLVELALDAAQKILTPKGAFLAKLFQGAGSEAFIAEVKKHFTTVKIRKPRASRPKSREVYLLASGFVGYNDEQTLE